MGAVVKANLAVADINLIGGKRAMLVDSITEGGPGNLWQPLISKTFIPKLMERTDLSISDLE